MIGKIKGILQEKLYQKCKAEYDEALRYQTDPYLLWIKENEQTADEGQESSYPALGVVYMENCAEGFSLADCDKEILLFVSERGRIAVGGRFCTILIPTRT